MNEKNNIKIKTSIERGKERLDKDDFNDPLNMLNLKEHISRYVFASKLVNKKIILDVACGIGYGTKILNKNNPETLVGVDNSRSAISNGKKLIKGSKINLIKSDARFLPFRKNTFDGIISFETIEHIEEYEKFLQDVKRVIKRNGTLIISTPNKEVFSGSDKFYENDFHHKEFNIKEFYTLLRTHFDKVDLYGETPINTAYNFLRDIRKKILLSTKIDLLRFYKILTLVLGKFDQSAIIYPIQKKPKDIPKYIIAKCGN